MKGWHGASSGLEGGQMIQSKKLSARIEPYRKAIAAARAAGVTWEQIASALGCKPKYLASLYHKPQKYQAIEQLPLPEPERAKKIVQPVQAQRPLPTVPGQPRPLPTVPGQKIPDQDELKDEFAKHGLHFR